MMSIQTSKNRRLSRMFYFRLDRGALRAKVLPTKNMASLTGLEITVEGLPKGGPFYVMDTTFPIQLYLKKSDAWKTRRFREEV